MSLTFKIDMMDFVMPNGHKTITTKLKYAMTVGHLLFRIRKCVKLGSEDAIYLFIDGVLYGAPTLISLLKKHQKRGVVPCKLYREATFGGRAPPHTPWPTVANRG